MTQLLQARQRHFPWKSIGAALIGIGVILSVLQSSYFFREKRAHSYVQNRQWDKAVVAYETILRKEMLPRSTPFGFFSPQSNETWKIRMTGLYFELANIYIKLNMKNLAIKAYGDALRVHPEANQNHYDSWLLALAALEQGNPVRAKKELEQLLEADSAHEGAMDLLQVISKMEAPYKSALEMNDLIRLATTYAENGLEDEARDLLTQRILEVTPAKDALISMGQYFSGDSGKEALRSHLFGERIYLTLAAFEGIRFDFKKSYGNWPAESLIYRTDRQRSHSGTGSEMMDVQYAELKKNRSDTWVKELNIPIQESDRDWGLDLFMKSATPFQGSVLVELVFDRRNDWVMQIEFDNEEQMGGWYRFYAQGFYERAVVKAKERGWPLERLMISKVLLDTKGYSNRIHVDDLRIYLNETS